MIADVDAHIVGRFAKILLTQAGEEDPLPLTVYGPGASRPKGATIIPCVAISRYLPFSIDVKRARPWIEVFTASEEEQTIQIPEQWGGGEMTGPAEWTWRPCPTPIELHYQIDLLATTQEHADGLLTMLLHAIPVPYRPEIAGKNILMLPQGDPVNLDELEAPLFRTVQRYLVTNVWIDRLVTWTKPSIADPRMEFDAEY